MKRRLIFENGRVFEGSSFGAAADTVCEAVLNTSMVGYQELISDPVCTGQLLCMTYPLIGNYGLTDEDYESKSLRAGALVVREYNDYPSNFRYTKTLAEAMEEEGVPGLARVDTRAITRMLRTEGTLRALMTDDEALCVPDALARIAAQKEPQNLVERVSCKKAWFRRTPGHRYTVVAVDCGIRLSAVEALTARGCNVAVVPYDTDAERVLALSPDALLLSDGPGDPHAVPAVTELTRALLGRLPILGLGLGHQVLALAAGGTTAKLPLGHHGGNQPVRDLATRAVEITAQHHSYIVRGESLAGTGLVCTHRNLLDDTVEGLADTARRAFSVQYMPENAPGPNGAPCVFDRFIAAIGEYVCERGERNA